MHLKTNKVNVKEKIKTFDFEKMKILLRNDFFILASTITIIIIVI